MLNYDKLRQACLARRDEQTNKIIAPAIGISESALSRFFDGGTLSLESYGKLCDWLGCSLDEFWGGTADTIDQRMRRVVVSLLATDRQGAISLGRDLMAVANALDEEFGE